VFQIFLRRQDEIAHAGGDLKAIRRQITLLSYRNVEKGPQQHHDMKGPRTSRERKIASKCMHGKLVLWTNRDKKQVVVVISRVQSNHVLYKIQKKNACYYKLWRNFLEGAVPRPTLQLCQLSFTHCLSQPS